LSPGEPHAPSGDTSFPIAAATSSSAASRNTPERPKAAMSASMPIWMKNTGMNRWPTGASSRRMTGAWPLRLRAMPARNAPMIGASRAASASRAKASVNASARATKVPAERASPLIAPNSGPLIRRPTTPARTMKPTATATMPATDSADTDP
jgi:hypothetical protein